MQLKEFGKFEELPSYIDNIEFRKFINDCWHNRYTLYDDNYLLTNLIYWLRNSNKIKFPLTKTSLDFRNINNPLEIFIFIFSKYTSEVLYRNPFNNYEETEEDLEFLKGRLNTSVYLKDNLRNINY